MADQEYAIVSYSQARARGDRFYFTGRPCKFGHVARRYADNATCVACASEKNRSRYQVDGDRLRQNVMRRQKADPDRHKSYCKIYYHENKDADRARKKRWAEANPDKIKEHGIRMQNQRRAQARGSSGPHHTAADARAILIAQGYRCIYCDADLRKVKRNLDHRMPLALGGSNGPENLDFLCRPCNASKGAQDPILFARSLGRLI